MSSNHHVVRSRKLRIDRAVSDAYARVRSTRTRAILERLLTAVRQRGPALLSAPRQDGRHPGVEALVNLAQFTDAHVRPIGTWPGSDASWRGVVNSLAQHLIGTYPVPRFLGAAWYAADDRYAHAKRCWFVAHARGRPFRTLALPIRLTRRMEHLLLRSRDHFGIEYALRRAELVGLGVDETLTDAVLGTRPALDLDHGDFWRSVWFFLIANRAALDLNQVGPLMDFLHAVRHERFAVDTASGIVMREPPQPGFSVRGRTVQSLMRLVDDWHRELGLTIGGLQWPRSALRPMVMEVPREDPSEPPIAWELTELTTSAQLRAEGSALQHCVASYAHACWRSQTRIWSVRRHGLKSVRSIVTIEVDLATRSIVQVRGFRNRTPTGTAMRVVSRWAERERLRLALRR